MLKALVLAAVTALSFSSAAVAQERFERHVTVQERHVERHHDRHDRMDRRHDRHDRWDRDDRRRHHGHNRYHCHNVKKVVYRDGVRKVIMRRNCHNARH